MDENKQRNGFLVIRQMLLLISYKKPNYK